MKSKAINILAATFALFIFWIIYTVDTGGTLIFTKMIRFLPYPDKWGHCILYGVLTLLVNLALKFKRISFFSFKPYLGAVLIAVFAVLEELSQGWLPTRNMDYVDVIADAVGIIFFSWVTWRLERKSISK